MCRPITANSTDGGRSTSDESAPVWAEQPSRLSLALSACGYTILLAVGVLAAWSTYKWMQDPGPLLLDVTSAGRPRHSEPGLALLIPVGLIGLGVSGLWRTWRTYTRSNPK